MILLAGVLSLAFAEMGFQEATNFIHSIKDNVSVDVSDANFEDLMKNSTSEWFLYFYHPKCYRCLLFSPQWKFFAKKALDKDWKVNIGKVNLADNPKLRSKFGVHTFPSFQFYDKQYAYNYTGKTEAYALEEVIFEQTYLQYDRKLLEGTHYTSFVKRLAKTYPFYTVSSVLLLLVGLSYLPVILKRTN